ncbi:hypothetical protein AtubIFM55763_007864 [Aspergillus tubingensis]|uniref:EthD domain-containing protein n=2 Tax=Aspergillus tubingensis TaxID=5068 RepID=A0A1L9N5V4_ASPTC|nr:dimeric alpha-beta barrel [Aspergillus tubingensis]OJI84514.1 hypothetical protein ASPTUDRAFT_30434 [Aspergillus tubingensis CBS 134.48]GFN20308.1 dimeric alpha-beta barrel [Aspergillus tubingensis]GLA61634.1 hypothetical protein AtubIFM54640_002158 [Aspergillus tubingensis]GLA76295.1 hypothetical protein AtubIFM55763_007864 [Aspergillus tubingensis]GLA87066.1 hypothetical protein AtubIFM56815_011338 [Aspergillus tubingensis]
MVYTVTVLYPNEADAKYDLEYYLSHHLPLVDRLWRKYGLHGWTVVKYGPGVTEDRIPYSFGCVLFYEDDNAAKQAFKGPEAAEVLGDISKFSNKQPLFLYGERISTGGSVGRF